jgi:hypothetical protein
MPYCATIRQERSQRRLTARTNPGIHELRLPTLKKPNNEETIKGSSLRLTHVYHNFNFLHTFYQLSIPEYLALHSFYDTADRGLSPPNCRLEESSADKSLHSTVRLRCPFLIHIVQPLPLRSSCIPLPLSFLHPVIGFCTWAPLKVK